VTLCAGYRFADEESDNAMWYPEDNPYAPRYTYAKEDVLQFAMLDAASLHIFVTHVVCALPGCT